MLLKAKYDAVALTFAHRSACDLLRKDYLLRMCGSVRLRAQSHIAAQRCLPARSNISEARAQTYGPVFFLGIWS